MAKFKPFNRRLTEARIILKDLVVAGKCHANLHHLTHATQIECDKHLVTHGYEYTSNKWQKLHDDITQYPDGVEFLITHAHAMALIAVDKLWFDDVLPPVIPPAGLMFRREGNDIHVA